jgi:hypothetical protein
MSIIRLMHIKIDPSETENALLVWKAECAPLRGKLECSPNLANMVLVIGLLFATTSSYG